MNDLRGRSGGGQLLVVTECYPRPVAPTHCAFAHRQMTGLRQSGWRVEVGVPNGWYPRFGWHLTAAWRGAHGSAIQPGWSLDGIPIGDLTFANGWPGRLFARQAMRTRIADAIVRRVERANPGEGMVLMAQFALPYGPSVRDAARRLALPYVVQLRGDDVWIWPHSVPRAMDEFIETVRGADLVTGVSRSLVTEAERLAGKLPSTAVVPNGIDLATFRPPASASERHRCRETFNIGSDEVAIVCVGDAIVRKGWLDLLDALGALSNTPVRIALVAALANTVDEIDLAAEAVRRAPRVRLCIHRGLRAPALAELYRAGDVFCLASHWEGMSNALLEAMASGLPCVATAVAGHPEVITDGFDGVLVPPKNADALSAAIAPLVGSAEARGAMGEAARMRAEAVGTSTKAGARLAALLHGVRTGAFDSEMLAIDPYAGTAPGVLS